MGEALEIAKVLVSPTEKLIDVISNGIGVLYEPKRKRKMTDATVYEINQIGEAVRNNSDVIISCKDGSVTTNSPEFEDFVKRTEHRMLYQEMRRQHNIEMVVGQAYLDLDNLPPIVDEPVNSDWVTRLFDIVKDVSSEEMQLIWGKILAGEIKRPGSFSLRTLDTIRNLSQNDATTFQKILPFVIEGDGSSFVTSKSSIYSKYGITYDDIMLLDECGLIVSDGMISSTIKISHDSVIIHNKNYALLTEGVKREKSFTYGVHCLTNAGMELLSILEYESENKFFIDFVEWFFNENKHSKLRIEKIKSINGNTINTTGEIIREYQPF